MFLGRDGCFFPQKNIFSLFSFVCCEQISMNAAHKDLLLAQRLQSALIHQGLTVVTARKASVEMVTHALVSNFG